jgi:hypothetical protein
VQAITNGWAAKHSPIDASDPPTERELDQSQPRRLSNTLLLAEQKLPLHVMVVREVDRGQKGRAAIGHELAAYGESGISVRSTRFGSIGSKAPGRHW